MYAADNGFHYLYLFREKHKECISTMLLTKSYKQNVIEVIGMALGLENVLGAEQSLGRDYIYTEKIYKRSKKNILKKKMLAMVEFQSSIYSTMLNNKVSLSHIRLRNSTNQGNAYLLLWVLN